MSRSAVCPAVIAFNNRNSHISPKPDPNTPAATPGSGPSSAAAAADADAADAPPADVQAAYVAQYMATVARLAAAQAGAAADQKKPEAGGAVRADCMPDL